MRKNPKKRLTREEAKAVDFLVGMALLIVAGAIVAHFPRRSRSSRPHWATSAPRDSSCVRTAVRAMGRTRSRIQRGVHGCRALGTIFDPSR